MLPPTVTITANQPTIEEGQEGSFTVKINSDDTRYCNKTETVDVGFEDTGTAIRDVDYGVQGWESPLNIVMNCTCDDIEQVCDPPKGEKEVKIQALTDALLEGDESVVLWASDCPVGFSCIPDTATMTIVDKTQALIAKLSGDAQIVTAGQPLQPFVVRVTSGAGTPTPLPDQSVRWEIIQGDGKLSNSTSTTNAAGEAATTLTPGTATQFRVRATLVSTAQSVEFTAQTAPVQGQISKVSGDAQIVTSGQPFEPFVVRVTTAGSPLAGLAVDWKIEQGDGKLSNSTSTTNAAGEATTVLTMNSGTQFRVRATLVETRDSVEFSSLVSSLEDIPGLPEGPKSVARAFDQACSELSKTTQARPLTTGEQDMLDQCRKLIPANPSEAAQGVIALTPEQASAPRKLITQISSLQVTNLVERLRELRRGAKGISIGGLKVGLADQTFSGSLLERVLKRESETGGGASADEDWPFERLGIFITGDVQWGKKDKSVNEDGFDYDRLGLTAGADYRFTNGLILGTALGYSSTGVDIDADGGSLGDDSWSLSVYGTYYPTDHFYLEGSAIYGWDRYDQDRTIDYGLLGAKRTATAGFDGEQLTLLFGAGYDLIRGGTIIDMFGRVQYVSASIDSYREQGASGLDLVIQGQDAISLKSILGTQVSHSISTRSAVLSLQGWLQWEHEFEDGDEEVTGYFANDPSQFAFTLPVDALETDLVRLGLGVGAQFGQGRTGYVSYQMSLGMEDYTDQTVTAGVNFRF